MNAHSTTPRNLVREQGVSLIEVMVAMVLGLVLIGGTMQVFVANRAAYNFNEGLQRLQENGRYALDTLSYNARMAGTLGCMSAVPLINNLTGPTALPFNFAQGITGYEAVGTAPADTQFTAGSVNPANSTTANHWAPDLIAPVLNNAIRGSDVLVIRTVSPTSHSLMGAFATGTNVYAAATSADYAVGDIAIVADCQKASVFQISGVTQSVVGGVTQVDLTHTASSTTPGNALATWNTDQSYALGAQIARADTWIYYVGASAAGPPALFQMRLQTTGTTSAPLAEELVRDVDTMQITYGVDTDTDGDLDAYQTANSVANWATVVTVRIGLLMRSPENNGSEVDAQVYLVNGTDFDPSPSTGTDRRVRQVFTTTTAIRNRLP